jgi:hypothetical protein
MAGERESNSMQVDIQTARLCARAFTRPTIAALARGKSPTEVLSFLRHAEGIPLTTTVGEFFDATFEIIKNSYRNEYFFKTTITNKIVFGRHSPRTCSLSVELPVGKSIVDLAIFNGASTAYEIKTHLDTPRRLTTQTPDYLRVFDKVFVVTTPALGGLYADLCDPRVGVLVLNGRDSLSVVRTATENFDQLDIRCMYRMLRKSEYQPALEEHFLDTIDVPNGMIARHCENLFLSLPKETAHLIFRNSMRKRKTQGEFADFITVLPKALRVLGYATPLNTTQQNRLRSCLSEGFQLRN